MAARIGMKRPFVGRSAYHVSSPESRIRQCCLTLHCFAPVQFPTLPLVGKLNAEKPLPVYESRVDEAGNIEVLV